MNTLADIVVKATEGPWALNEEPAWPFGIEINSGENSVISMRRHCYGTDDKTLDDVMRGKAFGPKERPEAVALNARQIADAQLIALAPTLAALVLEARETGRRLLNANQAVADHPCNDTTQRLDAILYEREDSEAALAATLAKLEAL